MLLQKNCAINFITFYLNVNNVKLSPSMTVTVQGVYRLQSTTITSRFSGKMFSKFQEILTGIHSAYSW